MSAATALSAVTPAGLPDGPGPDGPGSGPPAAPPGPAGSLGPRLALQLALPLEWELPSGLPARPRPAGRLRLVGAPDGAADGVGVDPALPPAGDWVGRLARAVVEVLAGERPAGQLARWASPPVAQSLARQARAVRGAGPVRPQCRQVRGVRVCAVRPDAVEASAVVLDPHRARAVAVRLEAVAGRWLATAVECR